MSLGLRSGASSNTKSAQARDTATGSSTETIRAPSSWRGSLAYHGRIANKSRVNAVGFRVLSQQPDKREGWIEPSQDDVSAQ